MDLLLEFFEKLDEMIYISDLDTNELVYMNRRLRESLGYGEHRDYVGQKCYQVLQGAQEPCAFCTNQKLEPGRFVSWIHKNPIFNKRYLIKDSMISRQGRNYRVEIAIDMDSDVVCNSSFYYVRSEAILNECLQRVFSTTDPEEGLELVLAYLGECFECDRVYVFEESEEGVVDNTYEWCAPGVTAQKEILQKVSLSGIDWWMHLFSQNKVVLIQDLEEIRTEYPVAYAILKPQNVSSLAAGPISVEGKVIGFLGADNPNAETMSQLTPLLNVIGYFIATLLRQRDLLRRLSTLSFHDPLTGAFNRNAMFEHSQQVWTGAGVGVIYCDVTGLKQVNDSMGHSAGDELLRCCYDMLRETLDTQRIYRTGGDEFVAVFRGCTQQALEQNVQHLHNRIRQEKYHVAVGYAWSEKQPVSLETLITQADRVMYQDKREYYAENANLPGVDRRSRGEEVKQKADLDGADSLFYRFLSTTYHDMDFLFRSFSQQNSVGYFFFGDIQKDIFYISDNMRDEFGFRNNVVPGLLKEWGKRIPSSRFRELYREELEDILRKKRTVHDMRYQVRNARGKNIWIRCYGLVKWDEEQKNPLFFSGRVTHQDDSFVVDPVTNFPRESVVVSRLEKLSESQQPCLSIGFSLNSITELNSTRGRTYSDHLVGNISDELMNVLAGKMSFYRLDGMRCLAVVEPSCHESKEQLVEQIREIIEAGYRARGISVHCPCSFALMEYFPAQQTPTDFLENIVSLIKAAKHDPKQTYLDDSEDNISKIKRMSNMALALSRDVLRGMENFRIVIQPVVSSKTGTVVGGEALLRWTFEGKDISPGVVIPILEKENLIQIAGRWVFEQVVCNCMRLVACRPGFYLTFNVSLYQLSDSQFTEFMQHTLAKYRLDGKHLVAEMTESCMDEQPEHLISFVESCKAMGIEIALDDFGSGYSSLRMLLQYPSAMIKLDRSLLAEMTESVHKMNFISSIVYACHRFGKKVCMEGVETESQNSLIKESGCDMIQGYYYYRPMELDDVYGLISTDEDEKRMGLKSRP